MPDLKKNSKSSPLRTVVTTFRIIVFAAFLLIILTVILIVIPAERDMKIRNAIAARVEIGKSISTSLIRFRNKNGFWPKDTAEFSRNNVVVPSDGVIRVYFVSPESIDGKWADLRISIENGRYYLSCELPASKAVGFPHGVERVKA